MSFRSFAAAVSLALVTLSAGGASWSAPAGALEARVLLPFVVGGRPPSECDPSYPTVCLPPPPPDLDCPEVLPLLNFPALPADPHGLDADKDGIACESP